MNMKQKIIISTTVIAGLLALIAWFAWPRQSGGQQADQADNFTSIQADIKNGAQLIDVRTADEFAAGHIEGATNLELDKIQAGQYPAVDKNTTIYVYCRSGSRSAQAKALLEKAGFSRVENLGGLADVQQMGGSVVR